MRLAARSPPRDGARTMLTRVSESEVSARLPELLERARAGETILIERDGVAVCRLGPPGPTCTLDDFSRFLTRHHQGGGTREVAEAPQRLA